MRLRLAYSCFWPGFDPERSLFTWILRAKLGYEVEIVNAHAQNVDLEIRSVFTFRTPLHKMLAYGRGFVNQDDWWDYVDRADYGYSRRAPHRASRVLWFTGENRRPPLGTADGYLSFDVTDPEVPSLYFPFWMYRIDWGFDSHEVVRGMTPTALCGERAPIERPLNCCAFSTSREPGRLRLFDIVASTMPLDRYGMGIGQRVQNKFSVAQAYGFQACPENDVYPGYVTEKALEAWFSGNVPIWQGLDRDGWLNPNALIDTTGHSTAAIRRQLEALDSTESTAIRCRPILTRQPSLGPVKEFLQQVLA